MKVSEYRYKWNGDEFRVLVAGDVVSIPGGAGSPGWSMGGFGGEISIEWLLHEGGLPGSKPKKWALADMIRRSLAAVHGGAVEPLTQGGQLRGPFVRCPTCADSGMHGFVVDLPSALGSYVMPGGAALLERAHAIIQDVAPHQVTWLRDMDKALRGAP